MLGRIIAMTGTPLTGINGSNKRSVLRHSSDHVRPRFSTLFQRFYPRKSLGRGAVNEYLRCADRPWYSEATIGRNARINSNGPELARNRRLRKGSNGDEDGGHGDAVGRPETMPFAGAP